MLSRTRRTAMQAMLGSACCLAMLLCTASEPAAGQFRVTPIRLDFGKNTKSGVLTVMNEGTDQITLQVSAMQWTQDEQGKDAYEDTRDIVFYPRIMTLEPGEQRVIRTGTKGPQPSREETYRLFIEELPGRTDAGAGPQIAVLIRFAPPLFVRPVKESGSGVIESLSLAGGRLTTVVRNTGNVHFTITALLLRGKDAGGREVFSKEISGWYLLNGAARAYEANVPPAACAAMTSAEVEVKADIFTLNRTVHVLPEMCKP